MSGYGYKSYLNTNGNIEQPLGFGLEIRLRGNSRGTGTLDKEIEHSSIFGESGTSNVTTTLRTFGLSPLAPNNFIDYTLSAEQWFVTSNNANDTIAGTGAQKVQLVGLDGDWNRITETVEMNGLSGILTTRTDWFRINKIFVVQAGSGMTNEGTLFITNTTDTQTAGVPDNIVYSNVLPNYSAMSVFTYSVPAGFNFEYVFGNQYTNFTESKPGIFQEYYRDESGSGTLISSFTNLQTVGNISYNFNSAVGWYGKVTIEGRIQGTVGTNTAAIYYPFSIWKEK